MATEAGIRFRQSVGELGRPILGALFPDEFEVYMMTLELVDSEGQIVDYLSFPVLPDSVTKSEPEITNVKKTAGGVVSLTTNTFTPQDITINGNFGRSFKVLLGRELINFSAFGASLKSIGKEGEKLKNPFDVRIKTGYGCTKILQGIVTKSTKLDDKNKPYKLFFHNPTLGESYLVEKMNLTLSMDKNSNNMMWAYNLTFKILAPANMLGETGASSLKKVLAIGALQKVVNTLAGDIGEIVRSGASDPFATVQGMTKKSLNSKGNKIIQGPRGRI